MMLAKQVEVSEVLLLTRFGQNSFQDIEEGNPHQPLAAQSQVPNSTPCVIHIKLERNILSREMTVEIKDIDRSA